MFKGLYESLRQFFNNIPDLGTALKNTTNLLYEQGDSFRNAEGSRFALHMQKKLGLSDKN
jgi:hypothetical protein